MNQKIENWMSWKCSDLNRYGILYVNYFYKNGNIRLFKKATNQKLFCNKHYYLLFTSIFVWTNQISVTKINKVNRLFWFAQRNGHFIIGWNWIISTLPSYNIIELSDKVLTKRQSNKKCVTSCLFTYVHCIVHFFRIQKWSE